MLTRRKINVIWTYYKSTLLINILCSVALPFADFPTYIEYFPKIFALSFVTLGLLVSFVYKEFVRRDEYYFYYNAHISRLQLYVACFVVNVFVSIVIFILI